MSSGPDTSDDSDIDYIAGVSSESEPEDEQDYPDADDESGNTVDQIDEDDIAGGQFAEGGNAVDQIDEDGIAGDQFAEGGNAVDQRVLVFLATLLSNIPLNSLRPVPPDEGNAYNEAGIESVYDTENTSINETQIPVEEDESGLDSDEILSLLGGESTNDPTSDGYDVELTPEDEKKWEAFRNDWLSTPTIYHFGRMHETRKRPALRFVKMQGWKALRLTTDEIDWIKENDGNVPDTVLNNILTVARVASKIFNDTEKQTVRQRLANAKSGTSSGQFKKLDETLDEAQRILNG
jgi:hypothetical protein